MEGKIISLLIVFALTVLGAAWVLNLTAGYDMDSKLADANVALRGIETGTEHIGDNIATMIRSTQRIQDLLAKTGALETKLQEAQKRTASSKAEAEDFDNRFDTRVAEVRKEAVGTMLEEIKLKSGKVLRQVRIQRVDGEMLSVLYAEGTARLAKKDLPEELVERFQIQDPSPVKTAAPAKPKEPVDNSNKLKEWRDKLAVTNASIQEMNGNLELWERKEREYKSRYQYARVTGKSSSIVQLTDAEANVVSLTKQLSAARAQVALIEHEIETLSAQQGQ